VGLKKLNVIFILLLANGLEFSRISLNILLAVLLYKKAAWELQNSCLKAAWSTDGFSKASWECTQISGRL
jgi:hypothetical protein